MNVFDLVIENCAKIGNRVDDKISIFYDGELFSIDERRVDELKNKFVRLVMYGKFSWAIPYMFENECKDEKEKMFVVYNAGKLQGILHFYETVMKLLELFFAYSCVVGVCTVSDVETLIDAVSASFDRMLGMEKEAKKVKETKIKDGKLVCDICGVRMTSYYGMQKHYEIVHNEKLSFDEIKERCFKGSDDNGKR